MAADFTSMFPQLIGMGASIAGTIPNEQDRLQRRIAMGGEDPALAAVRRTLAAQNAQTAMAVAASQQGVNPALASRNAQQALAQTQIQTNAEIARLGMGSAQQARGSDPKGQKIGAALQGAGQLANVFGTGMAAQNAGLANGPGADPTSAALNSALVKGGPQMASPVTPVAAYDSSQVQATPVASLLDLPAPQQTQMPVGPDGQPVFDASAPSAAQGVPSAQFAPGAPPGSGVTALPTPTAPAAQGVPVPQVNMTGVQLPQSTQVPASEAYGQVTGEQPVAPVQPQFAPPTAQPAGGNLGPQSRGVPSLEGDNPDVPEPQFRPSDALPPEITSNPMSAGLLQMYDELSANGDDAGVEAVLRILQSLNGR